MYRPPNDDEDYTYTIPAVRKVAFRNCWNLQCAKGKIAVFRPSSWLEEQLEEQDSDTIHYLLWDKVVSVSYPDRHREFWQASLAAYSSGSGSESDVQLQNNCTMNKRKTDRRNVVCILFSFLGIRLEGYFQKFQCKKKVKRDGGSHFPWISIE